VDKKLKKYTFILAQSAPIVKEWNARKKEIFPFFTEMKENRELHKKRGA